MKLQFFLNLGKCETWSVPEYALSDGYTKINDGKGYLNTHFFGLQIHNHLKGNNLAREIIPILCGGFSYVRFMCSNSHVGTQNISCFFSPPYAEKGSSYEAQNSAGFFQPPEFFPFYIPEKLASTF
jgi:hypothetical protein